MAARTPVLRAGHRRLPRRRGHRRARQGGRHRRARSAAHHARDRQGDHGRAVDGRRARRRGVGQEGRSRLQGLADLLVVEAAARGRGTAAKPAAAAAAKPATAAAKAPPAAATGAAAGPLEVRVPDLGDFKDVEVIEVQVEGGRRGRARDAARHARDREGDDGRAVLRRQARSRSCTSARARA